MFDQYPDVIFMLAVPFQLCNMILIVHVLARTPKLVKRGVKGVRSGNIPHDAREMSRWAEVTTGEK